MAKSRYWNGRRGSGQEVLYNDSNKIRELYEEVVQKELENGSTAVAYNTTIRLRGTNILADMCFCMTSELLSARFVYLSI